MKKGQSVSRKLLTIMRQESKDMIEMILEAEAELLSMQRELIWIEDAIQTLERDINEEEDLD